MKLEFGEFVEPSSTIENYETKYTDFVQFDWNEQSGYTASIAIQEIDRYADTKEWKGNGQYRLPELPIRLFFDILAGYNGVFTEEECESLVHFLEEKRSLNNMNGVKTLIEYRTANPHGISSMHFPFDTISFPIATIDGKHCIKIEDKFYNALELLEIARELIAENATSLECLGRVELTQVPPVEKSKKKSIFKKIVSKLTKKDKTEEISTPEVNNSADM